MDKIELDFTFIDFYSSSDLNHDLSISGTLGLSYLYGSG